MTALDIEAIRADVLHHEGRLHPAIDVLWDEVERLRKELEATRVQLAEVIDAGDLLESCYVENVGRNHWRETTKDIRHD
jgi:hypothetical protein